MMVQWQDTLRPLTKRKRSMIQLPSQEVLKNEEDQELLYLTTCSELLLSSLTQLKRHRIRKELPDESSWLVRAHLRFLWSTIAP